jgi:hypothetical protein
MSWMSWWILNYQPKTNQLIYFLFFRSMKTQQSIIDSTDAANIYYGSADLGRAETAEKWVIYKKVTAGSIVTIMYPIGEDGMPSDKEEFAWSERDHYNYALVPDTAAPTLSTVTIASNNSTTTLAKVGDTVTLTIIASEIIETPVVTIGAGAATVTLGIDELHWTAARTMTSADVNGTVTFSIAFEDKGGKAGTTVTALTGGSAVTFDKTVPTLSTVSIASNNATPTLAKEWDTVTVTIISTEALKTKPTFTIATHAIDAGSVTQGGDATQWTATYVMVAGDTTGAVPFTINGFDLAGNALVTVSAVTDASSVTYDKTAPLFVSTSIVSNNADTAKAKSGDIVTFIFTTSEALASNPTVAFGGQAMTYSTDAALSYTYTRTLNGTETEGTAHVLVSGVDLAWNITTPTDIATFATDFTAPTFTVVTTISDNSDTTKSKVGDTVTTTFTRSQALLANPTVTFGTKAMTFVSLVWTTYEYERLLDGTETEGSAHILVTGTDTYGNTTTNSDIGTFATDFTAPTASTVTMASDNANTAYAKVGDTVTLTIVTNEDTMNVVATIDGNSATTVAGVDAQHWTATYVTQTGDTAGALAFTLDFKDLSGNSATQIVAVTGGSAVVFDEIVPELSSVAVNSNTQLTVTLTELALASTITKANDGWFVVAETGAPWTTYAVSAIAPGATDDLVVLTVASMAASSAAGVTVTYANAGNGTVSDKAGNLLATDATGVIAAAFDKTAPTASTVTMTSNNSDNKKAKVWDEITLTIITNEDTKDIVATLDGNAMTTVAGIDAQHWTATYTMTSGWTEGNLAFTLDFKDLANNSATQVTAVTAGGVVVFDKTAPTMVSAAKDLVTQFTVTLSSTTIEASITKANSGGFTIFETGNPSVTYDVTGTAKNSTTDKVALTCEDTTASAAAGVTIVYQTGIQGTVTDLTGNAMVTDLTGVVVASW